MSMDSETMYVKPIEPATKDDALVALYVGAFVKYNKLLLNNKYPFFKKQVICCMFCSKLLF